jgi:hypothetical protein
LRGLERLLGLLQGVDRAFLVTADLVERAHLVDDRLGRVTLEHRGNHAGAAATVGGTGDQGDLLLIRVRFGLVRLELRFQGRLLGAAGLQEDIRVVVLLVDRIQLDAEVSEGSLSFSEGGRRGGRAATGDCRDGGKGGGCERDCDGERAFG